MHRVRNNILALVGILVIALIAAWICFGGDRTEHILGSSVDFRVRQGLDLQGGYQILLQTRQTNVDQQRLQAARDVIEKRVNGIGTNEPNITIQGNNRISVELPGVTDEDTVKKAIGSTGRLEFIDAGNSGLQEGDLVQTTYCTTGSLFQQKTGLCGAGVTSSTIATGTNSTTPGATGAAVTPGQEQVGPAGSPAAATPAPAGTPAATPAAATTPGATPGASTTPTSTTTPAANPGKLNANGQPFQTIITGEQLDPSKIDVLIEQTGAREVGFGTKAEAASLLGTFTSQHIGQVMAIVLDGKVISAPTVQGTISNQGQITSQNWVGAQGQAEVTNLVQLLKYGSLPVELDVINSRSVGATLGTDSIDRSIRAAIVGLGIVAAFMILYFRLPGVLAVLALMIYTMISFAVFKTFGIVLTLAGIAGFILSIGMAVDANVLIFARMKEELRLGRSVERSVEEGFRNAWPSIRDSNISTLITCLILYWFGDFTGTSTIKGFALTLAVGVLCSLFTAITVTHTFLRLMFLITGGQRRLARAGWWFGMNRTAKRTEEVQRV